MVPATAPQPRRVITLSSRSSCSSAAGEGFARDLRQANSAVASCSACQVQQKVQHGDAGCKPRYYNILTQQLPRLMVPNCRSAMLQRQTTQGTCQSNNCSTGATSAKGVDSSKVRLPRLTIVLEHKILQRLVDRKVEAHVRNDANHAGQPSPPQSNQALLQQSRQVLWGSKSALARQRATSVTSRAG